MPVRSCHRGALSVVHLVQRNRKCFTSSFSTPQARSGDSAAPILCRYSLILPITYNDVGNLPVVVDAYNAHPESSLPTEERRILGLRRKAFFILLPVVLVLVLACAVGGGVDRTIAARNREQTTSVPTDLPPPTPTRGQ